MSKGDRSTNNTTRLRWKRAVNKHLMMNFRDAQASKLSVWSRTVLHLLSLDGMGSAYETTTQTASPAGEVWRP
ncbi:hypothetical protein Q8A67_025494 [Cirrhinus molitorella]|uniref:Uncharacterized protein n=1 Tax=Cirrhinus molitorella TaxID=172907 RepID=A0AA88NUQ7_9TELE|nr:hypothetical protein Q8A67_025494 [Cirrhinus molitorella]